MDMKAVVVWILIEMLSLSLVLLLNSKWTIKMMMMMIVIEIMRENIVPNSNVYNEAF